jgi:hypothetical protein
VNNKAKRKLAKRTGRLAQELGSVIQPVIKRGVQQGAGKEALQSVIVALGSVVGTVIAHAEPHDALMALLWDVVTKREASARVEIESEKFREGPT